MNNAKCKMKNVKCEMETVMTPADFNMEMDYCNGEVS